MNEVSGIGGDLADRIIENRPYDSWEEVEEVHMFDGTRMKKLKEETTL